MLRATVFLLQLHIDQKAGLQRTAAVPEFSAELPVKRKKKLKAIHFNLFRQNRMFYEV